MKTLICSILLSLPLMATAQDAPLEVFRVPDFNLGVVTNFSPILIPNNAVQDARNVYFDNFGITRRKGYSQFNSAILTDVKSVRGVWPFTADDGTRYITALSSSTIYKAPTSGIFTAIPGLSGLSATADMDAVFYLGKIWFANGVDSMAYWDGASTATVTEAPLGGMIEGWRNRIVTAGVASMLSYVYMSKELDGEEWTTGPTLSVSPVAIAFGGLNAKPIKCVYGGYRDFLMVANEDETYGVYGFGRNDFVVRTISREVGCIEDKSVQEKDGALYWMSRRGIEKMTPQGGIQRITDGVKDVFDTMINNTAINRLKLYTTQAHWEAGNLTASGAGAPISATISPGSLVPSTWTAIDTSSADFAGGTVMQVSTNNPLSPDSVTLDGETFTDLNCTHNPVWTTIYAGGDTGSSVWTSTPGFLISQSTGCRTYLNPVYGESYCNIFSSSTLAYGDWSFDIYRPANSRPAFMFISADYPPGSLTTMYYGVRIYEGTVELIKDISGVREVMCEPSFDSDNVWSSYHVSRSLDGIFIFTASNTLNSVSCTATDNSITTSKYMAFTPQYDVAGNIRYYVSGSGIDNIYGNVYKSTGTYTSKIFNTSFSTPTGGPFDVTMSTPIGTTINYYIRSSTSPNNDLWGPYYSSSDTLRVGATQQYWQYKADFTTSYSTVTPQIDDITLQAATTGFYIHDCASTGDISSWGNFQANSILSGGSIGYFVSTGTTCDSVERATATWTAQNNNAPIIVGTAAYIGVKDVFTITSSTNTSILQDVTINWLEGTSRPPVASAVYLNRYYLAYTTSSASSVNDFMFVADKNDAATFLDNMNCYSLGLFNRKMFCGSANANGKIYEMENGEDDDGSAFTSYFRTKAYAFGDTDAEKEFVKMYASFSPEAESVLDINITPSYHLDLSSSAITLNPVNTGEDATAGMLVSKIPFALDNNISGRFLDVSFSNTGINSAWTLFNLNVYFRKYEVK